LIKVGFAETEQPKTARLSVGTVNRLERV